MTTDFALASQGATIELEGGYWGGAGPGNIIDGDDATGCDLDSPRVIKIDLGQARTISSIRVHQGYLGDGGNPYLFTWHSDDGSTWGDPDDFHNPMGVDDTWDIGPITSRHWKFSAHPSIWWGVFTLSLFGEEAPPPSGSVQVVIV
jgi:hypothetical protein